jgi:hypothetical protein
MDFEKIAQIIQDTFRSALEKPIYRYGMPIKKGTSSKIATGSLRNSIEAIPTNQGIFVFMNDYGKWVQSGRLPGKYVPIAPLEKWVKDKGLNFTDKNGKAMTPRQMAYAISKSIHRFGIATDPSWMDVAIEELLQNKELEDLLGQMTVDELIEKIEGI